MFVCVPDRSFFIVSENLRKIKLISIQYTPATIEIECRKKEYIHNWMEWHKKISAQILVYSKNAVFRADANIAILRAPHQ